MTELKYIGSGDYLLPDLRMSVQENKPLGKYGRLRRAYLREHRPVLFTSLLLSEKLYPHLAEIDRICTDRLARIVRQMKLQEGVTETLKASDPMAWVQRMNLIRNRAEEIVLQEVVYS